MEKLVNLVNIFTKIKENYFWIDFYTRAENTEKIAYYEYCNLEIYKELGINNYNQLLNMIIGEYANTTIGENRYFLKNIINLISIDTSMNYDNTIFKEMYKDIIINNKYNPNWNIGTSSEPLFGMLPEESDLYEVNMLVFDNENIDWNILKNESDALIYFMNCYLNAKDNETMDYYFNIVKKGLKSIDLDSTTRYKSESKVVKYEIEPVKLSLAKLSSRK